MSRTKHELIETNREHDTLGRSEQEMSLTDEEVIAQRTADHSAFAARHGIVPPVEAHVVEAVEVDDKKPTLASLIAKVAAPAQAADANAKVKRREEAEAMFRPLLTRGQSAITALGIWKKKHLARIEAVLALDWEAARRGLPHDWVGTVSPSRTALNELQTVARDAVTALKSSYTGVKRDARAIDAPDLGGVMEDAEAMIEADGAHDRIYWHVTSDARRLQNHLATWVARAERGVDSARQLVDRFDRAYARAEAVMAALTPASEPTPESPKNTFIPAAPEVRGAATTVADGATVTPLDGGLRVTGGR